MVPTFEDVRDRIAPILSVLHGLLEAGCQSAREFFEDRGHDLDPVLFPCLVRHEFISILTNGEWGKVVDRTKIANNGLALRYRGVHIRILKADFAGDVPPPGKSKPKLAFFGQQLAFAFIEAGEEPDIVNVILLWHTTKNHLLDHLSLACPQGGGSTRGSVRLHWHELLEHPAVTAIPVDGEIVIENDDDLDIAAIPDIDTAAEGEDA